MLKKYRSFLKKEISFPKQVFTSLMVVFFASIFILGVVFFVLYSSSFNRQIDIDNEKALRQTAQAFETLMAGFEQNAVGLSVDTDLVKQAQEWSRGGRESLPGIVSKLRYAKNANKQIYSIYIYNPNNQEVIGSNDGVWKADDFYDYAFLSELAGGGYSPLPLRKIIDNTGEEKQLFSIHSSIEDPALGKKLYIIFNIDVVKLSPMLSSAHIVENEYTLIFDSNNIVISSTDPAQIGMRLSGLETAGHRQIRIDSVYYNWTFVNSIPKSYAGAILVKSTLQSILIGILCMILGVVIIQNISSRISSPINEAIQLILNYTDEAGQPQEISPPRLPEYVRDVLQQNRNLRQYVQGSERVLRSDWLQSILFQKYSADTIDKQQGSLGISFDGTGRFYLALFSVDHITYRESPFAEDDKALLLYGLENICTEMLEETGIQMHTNIGSEMFIVLLQTELPQSELLPRLQETRAKLKELMAASVTIAVSDDFGEIAQIQQSYRQCKSLLVHRLELGSMVLSADYIARLPASTIGFQSLLEMQKQLLVQLREDNIKGSLAAIEQLVKSIKGRPMQHPDSLYMLMGNLMSELSNLAVERGHPSGQVFDDIKLLYQEMLGLDTIDEIGLWLEKTVDYILLFPEQGNLHRMQELILQVNTYVEHNYAEDLRVASIAEAVYLSPSYLSRLYKQQTGINLNEYITKVRMENARRFLADPNLKINDIAAMVCMGSANNFIRTFKKYEGVTPGQYRQHLAQEMLLETGDDHVCKG